MAKSESQIVVRHPIPFLIPANVPRRFTTPAACGAEKARLRQQIAVAARGGARYRHLEAQLRVLDDLTARLIEAERDREVLATQRADLQRAIAANDIAQARVRDVGRLRGQAKVAVAKLEHRARHPGLPPGVAGGVAGRLAVAREHLAATASQWEQAWSDLARAGAEEAFVRHDIALDAFLVNAAVYTVQASTHRGLPTEMQTALLAPNVPVVRVFDTKRCLCAPQSDAGGPSVFSPLAALSRLAGYMAMLQLHVLDVDARTLPDAVQAAPATTEA